jgi:hypothetical protein
VHWRAEGVGLPLEKVGASPAGSKPALAQRQTLPALVPVEQRPVCRALNPETGVRLPAGTPWVAIRDQPGLQSRAAAFNSSATRSRSRLGSSAAEQPTRGLSPLARHRAEERSLPFIRGESPGSIPGPRHRSTTTAPASSNGRTAVFEAADRGSNPRAGTSSSVAKWKGARLLTGRAQVRLLPLEPTVSSPRGKARGCKPRSAGSTPAETSTIRTPRSSSGRMAGFQSVEAGSTPVRGTDLLWV